MNEINFKLYICKQYKHLDKRISFDKVKLYVSNSKKIAHHSFLPFLRYERITEKYVGKQLKISSVRPIKRKVRTLMYSGHLDSYIYKYYSDLLNIKYNEWMKSTKLNQYSVAYRTNKKHQSSINFAAEAISFIESQKNALIIVGDFEHFFDTLDHRLLKERLIRVLNVQKLSDDWYNVFKSITKFAYIDKESLESSNSPLVQKKYYSYFNSIRDFRKYQKTHKCYINTNSYGIPQGNSLSGVLANIYAIDFDKDLSDLARDFNGFYQKYSDDFILVLNENMLKDEYGIDYVKKMNSKLESLADINRICLQAEKNKTYLIKDDVIYNSLGKESHVDYLGFTFDGINVKLREKSIYKFYREARKLIYKSKSIKKNKNLKKLPNRHKIYSLYTDFGKSKYYPSNFISYVKRAQHIFDKISPNTNNLMLLQLKNRKKKIESALGYRIHSRIEKSNK